MPVAARCPSCGASLSETSVLALAPVCSHCGVVLTTIGGTLGLTSAYGVGDPTITRRRVEADLAVFHEYRLKYEGMLEACTQQLAWGMDRYAKLPPAPEFLELKVFDTDLISGWWWIVPVCAFGLLGSLSSGMWTFLKFIACLLFGLPLVGFFVFGPVEYYRVKVANGNRPVENARRQKAYEEIGRAHV